MPADLSPAIRIRTSVRRALFALLAALAPPALAASQYNLQPPASDIARAIYDLNTVINLVCLAIFFVVFVPMAIALVRDRKTPGREPARFHHNTKLELVWTVIPVLVLVGMAYPATHTVLAMKDTSAPDLTIKVTGYQWKWEYEYLGEGIRYLSNLSTPQSQIKGPEPKGANYLLETDRPLVVPANRKIRIVLTANDVIHAWWVPQLGIKQDAVPGFIHDAWFRADAPGVYRGQCAELCGVGHGYMPVVVEAVAPERFEAWKAEQKALAAQAAAAATKEYALAELMTLGEKVYLANCASCHQVNGAGIPGAFPALDGSKVVNGPVGDHLALVFHGRPGTAMPAFGKQLSDVDIAAVATYERNTWRNKTGTLAQPAQVTILRGKS